MAGTLGGFTTTLITNPLDIVRARLQVRVFQIFVHIVVLSDLYFCGESVKILWLCDKLKMLLIT